MGWYADHFFPWLIERLEGPEIYELRRRCVKEASGNVIEIGFGTGKTLPYYSHLIEKLTIVEPSIGMNRKTADTLAKSAFLTDVRPIKGERLPFEDNQFDSAVCTMTLCSVEDPIAVLSEIRRVLKPNARYHFLEHVLSYEEKIARKQKRFNPIQQRIGCGCNLTRDTEVNIQSVGFKILKIERIISQDMPGFDKRMYPIILGQAVNVKEPLL